MASYSPPGIEKTEMISALAMEKRGFFPPEVSHTHTLLETNISPKKWHFEDDFPFPQVGYVSSLEGSPCKKWPSQQESRKFPLPSHHFSGDLLLVSGIGICSGSNPGSGTKTPKKRPLLQIWPPRIVLEFKGVPCSNMAKMCCNFPTTYKKTGVKNDGTTTHPVNSPIQWKMDPGLSRCISYWKKKWWIFQQSLC